MEEKFQKSKLQRWLINLSVKQANEYAELPYVKNI